MARKVLWPGRRLCHNQYQWACAYALVRGHMHTHTHTGRLAHRAGVTVGGAPGLYTCKLPVSGGRPPAPLTPHTKEPQKEGPRAESSPKIGLKESTCFLCRMDVSVL